MSAAVQTAQVDPIDEIERGALADLDRLNARRRELALDVISDASLEPELSQVEADLAAAEAKIDRIGLARAERDRRDEVARADELDERQTAALGRARALQAEREAAAKAVDRAATDLAQALHTWEELAMAQESELRDAAQHAAASVASPRALLAEGAIAYAIGEAGGLQGDLLSRLPYVSPDLQKPLAEADPVAVSHTAKMTRLQRRFSDMVQRDGQYAARDRLAHELGLVDESGAADLDELDKRLASDVEAAA